MTALAELIAKLEAAPEGSRELDCEVALGIGWVYEKRGNSRKRWWYKPDVTNDYNRSSDNYWSEYPAIQFTTSIDAALTLVPETARLTIQRCFDNRQCRLIWRAEVNTGVGWEGTWREFKSPEGSFPALALCIAALKAREAQP